jgi:hypothetical protein
MSNAGYFLVYRRLFDHEIAENPLVVALWIKLLADASYEDKDVWWDGKVIQIKRGQLITSILKLSSWLRLAQGTTKRHLNALQKIGQIDIKTTNKYTVISIRNYNKYQINREQNENKLITNREQTETTKEYKETKEYNKERDASINYLLNIPSNDLAEFSIAFICTDRQIINKGQSLYDYCQSKGKVYKDYKAFLRNALRRDFGDRIELQKFNPDLPEEMSEEGLERLKDMKTKILGKKFIN